MGPLGVAPVVKKYHFGTVEIKLTLRIILVYLLPGKRTNSSPKNQWLENVFPIEIVPF